MRKKLAIAGVLLALVTLLVGCYPTGRTPIENSDIKNSDHSVDPQSSQAIEISDKFVLDIDVLDNNSSEIPAIKLALKTWSKEEIEQLFLSDKHIEEESERDETFYQGEKMYLWETMDKLRVVIQPGRFSYDDNSELDGKYKYGSVYTAAMNDCALIDDCYATNNELSVFSYIDAEKRVKDMTDKLGITNLGEPRIISINAELANTLLSDLEGSEDKAGEVFEYTPWTENEEIYILRYPQIYENTELAMTPITYKYSDKEGGFVTDECGVIAVVSKDEILSLHTSTIFSESYETLKKVPVNYDANQALEKFKEYLSNLVPISTTKYYGCKLVYIPYSGTADNKSVMFKPAWEFAGYTLVVDEGASEFRYFLNRAQIYEFIWADTGYRYIEARG